MDIKEEKLKVAKEIIKLSKELGFYTPMSNEQYVTPELLAASHSLPELRFSLSNLKKTKKHRQ